MAVVILSQGMALECSAQEASLTPEETATWISWPAAGRIYCCAPYKSRRTAIPCDHAGPQPVIAYWSVCDRSIRARCFWRLRYSSSWPLLRRTCRPAQPLASVRSTRSERC